VTLGKEGVGAPQFHAKAASFLGGGILAASEVRVSADPARLSLCTHQALDTSPLLSAEVSTHEAYLSLVLTGAYEPNTLRHHGEPCLTSAAHPALPAA
jgi:hypothetical protein